MTPVFHFVIEDQAICKQAQDPDFDVHSNWRLFDHGVHAWSLQTYLELRGSPLNIEVGTEIRPHCINLIHAAQLMRIPVPDRAFVVSLEADYEPITWADWHIVQNVKQLTRSNATLIHLWTQPGLVERSRSRTEATVVGYAGELPGLANGVAEWEEQLRPDGLAMRFMDKPHWNDYSEIDILVGIRSFDGRTFDRKPPTKLFNAWLAGVPLVGGCDSAYTQVGRHGIDFFRAESVGTALTAIRRLRDDSALYASIVAEGRRSVLPYTRDKIREAWIRTLRGPVQERFIEFQRAGGRHGISWSVGRHLWTARRRSRHTLWRWLDASMRPGKTRR